MIRELLEYVVDDENTGPFEGWLNKLTEYMAPDPVFE
jgi:hypothetical protein